MTLRTIASELKMKPAIYLFFFALILISCKNKNAKETLLLADREAPLGWVYLRIYTDETFEFESRGLERRGDIYPGKIELSNDTISFHYKDSIPRAGSKAVINKGYVVYLNGDYYERLEIKKNELETK